MTTAVKRAGGAAVFTYPDCPLSSQADESVMFSAGSVSVSGHSWDQLIDELIKIRFLQDDWDGEGSSPPDLGVVVGATKLALGLKTDNFPPADRVIASVNGTIYFEWHTPIGYREIEVTSPLDAESRWVQTGSDKTEVVSLSFLRQ